MYFLKPSGLQYCEDRPMCLVLPIKPGSMSSSTPFPHLLLRIHYTQQFLLRNWIFLTALERSNVCHLDFYELTYIFKDVDSRDFWSKQEPSTLPWGNFSHRLRESLRTGSRSLSSYILPFWLHHMLQARINPFHLGVMLPNYSLFHILDTTIFVWRA